MEAEKEFWCFLGVEQSNLKVLYDGFFHEQNSYAFFLHPVPGANRKAVISDVIRQMEGKLPDCQLYFILYARVYELYGDPLVCAIRLKYPNSKLICYYGDLVQRHTFTLGEASKAFDDLFTFDLKEAERYKIRFLREPLGNIDTTPREIKYDVVFVGEDKGRLELIMDIYRRLKSRGFRCKFHIRSVPEEKRIHSEDIIYRGMPYMELLELDRQSRCILEIVQGNGAYSPTTRWAEAMLLRKNLLTNCPGLSDSTDSQIIYFRDSADIDFDRIRTPVQDTDFDWADYFSVRQMILSIKKSIS